MKEAGNKQKKDTPYCYGKLENVFPMGEDGLRMTPESCTPCRYRTKCLREAVHKGDGLTLQEEQVDRAYDAGMIGFFERWSRKKTIEKNKKK